MSALRIGTSAFTAAGWETAFYPAAMKPAEYLSYYATKFDTVEVDSTFYRTPSATTVRGWYNKTPKDFIFALKVPQLITHEKCLRDCDADFNEFMAAADLLGEKLGVMLLQFGYFNQAAFAGLDDFLARLVPFLAKLPQGYKFALEIRNKNWMVPKFVNALGERGVALALIDQSWVPRPWELRLDSDLVTGDGFTYVRLLGDRKGIEQQTKVWDTVIVNRQPEIRSWIDYLRPLKQRGVTIFVYVNNHYSGFGPATAQKFLEDWAASD